MSLSRRAPAVIAALYLSVFAVAAWPEYSQNLPQLPTTPDDVRGNEDRKLPNGKSQKDAIAKDGHEKALKEADDLIALAQQIEGRDSEGW
jgi:hypothetical protein